MLSRYHKRDLKLKSSLNASERWSSALKQDLKILEQIVIIIRVMSQYFIYCILERKKPLQTVYCRSSVLEKGELQCGDPDQWTHYRKSTVSRLISLMGT